jgi:DNA replication protein DnaC
MTPGIGSALRPTAKGSIQQGRPNPFPENMTAFLKIDDCKVCRRQLPWEWVPAVLLNGKALAGTAVWRSQLAGGLCPACVTALEREREQKQRAMAVRNDLVQLLGGEKPYREFTFERFEVEPGNRLAYERCKNFNPAAENLYLWGPCGVGKTHLAWAIARRCFEESLSVAITPVGQLSRKVRMKDPQDEQAAINEFVWADALMLDDLGAGPDTAFFRQILQEILDGRDFHDRAGLVVTSKYSLDELAARFADDSISSRLAGMCRAIEMDGFDHRLRPRSK